MIAQLLAHTTKKPETLAGREDVPDLGIEKFCSFPKDHQKQTMDNHVRRIQADLDKIKKSSGRNADKLRGLQIQALGWCDPHRKPGSCFGDHSVDLKLEWAAFKRDADGNVTMRTQWFTCYTIALGSNFDDPRTPMDADDITGTVSDKYGHQVTSKKLSNILDNAHKEWGWQGLSPHADLTKRGKVLVGNRVGLVWAPNADEAAQGWSVETRYCEFCYQDSGSNAQKNGPLTYAAVFGPKGSAVYTGYPGQLEMHYKFFDEDTGFLMNHTTKVEPTDRKVEEDGSVREQTLEEKAAVLAKDSTSAVQLEIGVKGTKRRSNEEFVLFGQMQSQPTVDLSGVSISDDSRPWLKREPYMTDEQLEEWRKAEAEREERQKAEEEERRRKLEELSRLQKINDLKESCNNAASRPPFFVYLEKRLAKMCAEHKETKDFTEWQTKGEKALAEARAIKAANAEPFEMVEMTVDGDSQPQAQSVNDLKEHSPVTDDEIKNYTFDDLTGEQYKLFDTWDCLSLNDASVGSMDAYYRGILSMIKNKKNPDEPDSCSTSVPAGTSGSGGRRSLSASGRRLG